ncbi:uncharacterized protein LOC111271300 [Varroa jacobsoni]|uniref:Uncharacterized protein n=1 Tax=Varroa destructor TaxID=109461 RepID=A0A7M7JLT7_VARDE|nr:uncharacterized protein LOC111244889 [Varroa destructor]XP_022707755.1 uncharacterized protein LOC111271300 [Varroa jacobsoni]
MNVKCSVNLLCFVAVITVSLTATIVSAEDDQMKKLEEQAQKCAVEVKLSNEERKAIKDIENQNRASEAELAELKEATPEKQRELIEKKAKKVEIEMKAALGEEKYAEFEKCILSAINLLAKSR